MPARQPPVSHMPSQDQPSSRVVPNGISAWPCRQRGKAASALAIENTEEATLDGNFGASLSNPTILRHCRSVRGAGLDAFSKLGEGDRAALFVCSLALTACLLHRTVRRTIGDLRLASAVRTG